jgi:flagellar hook-length control protein FliK
VQAAAPTALLTKNATNKAATPAKPVSRHGVQLPAKAAFHKVFGEKAKEVTAAAARDRSAILAALQKALKKGLAEGKPHLTEQGKAGQAKHGERVHQQPSNAAKIPLRLVLADETAEPQDPNGKHARKKLAHEPRHADGLSASALSIAAELLNGTKGSSGVPGHAPENTSKNAADRIGATELATARKDPAIHVHVIDVRKKTTDAPKQDSTAAMTSPRPAVPDNDTSAAILAKAVVPAENNARGQHRQDPPAPAPVVGALERLREMAGSELTRAAGIVVRDGGGEIKLLLKPESLGNVRIRMNLVDNAIEGRIIVDNPAVKHVFEGSLSSLMRALTAEGFQTASLQVSVGGKNADNGRPDREPAARVRRVGAEGFERTMPGVETMSLGDLLVNLFV